MSNGGAKRWCVIEQSISPTDRSRAVSRRDGHRQRARAVAIQAILGRSFPAVCPKRLSSRFFLGLVFGTVSCLMFLAHYHLGKVDLLEPVRAEMNDARLMSKTARRCYLYSSGDDIIGREDEERAHDAERKDGQ